MSQQNVEIVRALYQDRAPLTNNAIIAPDAEFDFTELYPDQPVLRGVAEMQRFRDSGPWGGSIRFDPQRYIGVDDCRVLVLVAVSSTGQESGVAVRQSVAQEFTLRGGRVVRVKTYLDPARALKAVGREE